MPIFFYCLFCKVQTVSSVVVLVSTVHTAATQHTALLQPVPGAATLLLTSPPHNAQQLDYGGTMRANLLSKHIPSPAL